MIRICGSNVRSIVGSMNWLHPLSSKIASSHTILISKGFQTTETFESTKFDDNEIQSLKRERQAEVLIHSI